MKWKEEDLPALRELEATVVQLWLRHPEMSDYTAGRAYEAAYQHYRARLRGHPPKPPALTGLDLDLFKAVRAVCGKLLAAGAPLAGMPQGNAPPLILEKLVEYLRELAKSVERHQAGWPPGLPDVCAEFHSLSEAQKIAGCRLAGQGLACSQRASTFPISSRTRSRASGRSPVSMSNSS